jgi:seryl-tRNA synthetase
MDQREKDYAEYIESARNAIAKEREWAEGRMEKIHEQIPDLLARLKHTIETVVPDDNPSKSHWVVAQCREILRPWSQDETRIKRYLGMKDEVARFDREAAKMEEALGGTD